MNKYDVYTPEDELLNFINENGIEDKYKFPGSSYDFEYIFGDDNIVSFYNQREGTIDGCLRPYITHHLPQDAKEVSPEDFLIAIGYLPEKQKVSSSKVSPIKAEDIHYICELDGKDYLSVEKAPGQDTVYIKAGRDSSVYTAVKLSPEGLIELGSDLVRLGVSLRDGTYEE